MRTARLRLGARYATNLAAMVARQAGYPAAAWATLGFLAGETAGLARAAARAVRRGPHPADRHPPMSAPAIATAAAGLAAAWRPYTLDLAAFAAHCAAAAYPANYAGGPLAEGGMREQKALEYFVSLDLLRPTPGAILVDVASQWSLFPALARRLAGATVYRQDRIYRPGRHGERIGGDAAAMPLPAGFADALVLHNAFEHLEGAADTGFIREAWRVLRPSGQLLILPLLLSDRHYNVSDPLIGRRGLAWDAGARVVDLPGWHNRFGRFYDAPALDARVLGPARGCGFRPAIYHFANIKAVHPRAYLHFALLLEKPGEEPPWPAAGV